VLFEPVDQALHPFAETIAGAIKGAGPCFVLLAGNRDAEPVPPQVLADFPAAIRLVARHAARAAFRPPAPGPLDCAAGHQGFEGDGFVPLARGQDQRHEVAPAFGTEVNFGAEAALAAPERFGLRPLFCPSGMLVGPHNRAIDTVEVPVELSGGIRLLLDRRKEPVPEARLAPAIEAARHRLPGAGALWQIAPGRPGAKEPQDAIADATVVRCGTARRRFLGRKQRLEPLPLLVSQFMSVCIHVYSSANVH